MSFSTDPHSTPVGDVGTAMFLIDARLKGFREDVRPDPEEQKALDDFLASLGPRGAADVLDGACTLIYLFTQWLRQAHEAQDKDVLEYVLPFLVGTLGGMRRSVSPEAVPTMAAMVVASALGQSPTLWRKRHGPWRPEEMTALETTAFLLAFHINDLAQDADAATRMIMEALSAVEDGIA
ncbi:hypothetical protein ACIBF1_10770 [Spirillospora sp. NPDC050679]